MTPKPTLLINPTDSGTADVCGQRVAQTTLIIGSDAGDFRDQPGSDLTRLVRIDFSRRRIGIFALPRNLWMDVRSPGFQNPPINETALGVIYYEAYKRSVETEEAHKKIDGVEASAQTILDNFIVTSDYYIVIDLNQPPLLVDAIGGPPINIPERTSDPQIGMVIEAGPQTLSGDRLVAYAHVIPASDFSRIQRNNLLIHALRLKLLDPSVWVKLPTLYARFNEMFVTDLSPQQVYSIFCLLREVPKEEILLEQVKPDWNSPGPSDLLLWDKDNVISALKALDLLLQARPKEDGDPKNSRYPSTVKQSQAGNHSKAACLGYSQLRRPYLMKPLIIGVAGGTGSGKTTVVRKITEALDSRDIVVIQHDSYYRDRSHISSEERARINYDHPDALETDLFVDHLKSLISRKSVEIPIYDFVSHTRRKETVHIEPASVIVVEGILIFVDKQLRSIMDIKVYVDTDDDERFIRRLERDIRARGRSYESVVEQYLSTVKPMHLEFVEPSKRHADIIIPEGGNNQVAIDLFVTKLESLLERSKQLHVSGICIG